MGIIISITWIPGFFCSGPRIYMCQYHMTWLSHICGKTRFKMCTSVYQSTCKNSTSQSCLVWKRSSSKCVLTIKLPFSFICFYLCLSFLSDSAWGVLFDWLFFVNFNCVLSLVAFWCMESSFSPTLLSTGLLQHITTVCASHSSRFYVVFKFDPYMVMYCTLSVHMVHY